MWWRVAMEYIIERKINVKKLIMVAPAIKLRTKEVIRFCEKMKNDYKEINKYVEEIIVVYSNDDEVLRIDWIKEFLSQIKATQIELNWYWHFNFEEVREIEELV